MFENFEEPSGFWRKLWEERGTGNKNAVWLQEVKMAIHEKVTPLTGDEWALEVAEEVKVPTLHKKRKWSVAQMGLIKSPTSNGNELAPVQRWGREL